MQNQLLPKYGISSANLHTGAISAYKEGHWKCISLPSAAAHVLKPELLTITFNTQNQELQTLLLSSTVKQADFGQR